jgi:type 1 glutamine amidotransferase
MRLFAVLAIVFIIGLVCAIRESTRLTTSFETLTPEEIERVVEALPDRPAVKPDKHRKLLVFSLSWGFKHEAAQWAKPVFDLMAKKTGAFEAVISDDPAMFEPENINRFDGILFNNTNNEIFMPEYPDSLSEAELAEAVAYDNLLKESFRAYLKGGGGLAVLHAGLASFRKWPEFGEIMGARFDNHPWNAGSTVILKKEEPDHPLVLAFKEEAIPVTDEIYEFKELYSPDRIKVLLSIDTSMTDMTVPNIHRTDGYFPMSWIKPYGRGRVFYCALGHEKHIFWDARILRHFLDGIQFVLGDLECDMFTGAKEGE